MHPIRILVFFAAINFYTGARAQNVETDSLKKELVVQKDEKKRVSILEGLSYAYLSSSPDTALQYALQGLQLAQRIKYPQGVAICTNAIGNVYFHTGDNAKALEMYLSYLKMKENLKDLHNLSVAYFNIASVYTEEKDYTHALYYLFKTRAEDEKAKDTSAILYDDYSLGSVYLRMQKIDSALYYTNHSYQFAIYLDDKNLINGTPAAVTFMGPHFKNVIIANNIFVTKGNTKESNRLTAKNTHEENPTEPARTSDRTTPSRSRSASIQSP